MQAKLSVRSKYSFFTIFIILLIVVSGCATSHHNIDMQNGYMPNPSVKVEVGKVSNITGEKFDVDVEQMLSNALLKELGEEQLLYTSNAGLKLTVNCNILTYEKGNAFKRWLVPGWGNTSLSVQCDLIDSNKVVGSLNAMKSIWGGGGYTIGAWEKVFSNIADDVVADIKSKI